MPSTSHFKKRVLIIQEHTPHYRKQFFNNLREHLAARGIQLDLVHGGQTLDRVIQGSLEWSNPVRISRMGPFAWHHLAGHAKGADLVIVPQELKYLHCHLLLLKSRLTGSRFAYWGHGKNFQAGASGSHTERIKEFLSLQVHWWFAYNDLSAGIVRGIGFPAERITSVGNTIDTRNLIQLRQSITGDDLCKLRAELKTASSHIAVYTGGLYASKRIDFLLRSAITVRESIPDFELIVIGTGPEHQQVADAARNHPWIHAVGQKNDAEKVPYWALASVLLMPGGVGLVILDSFALGVPMVTTDTLLHGPEIDYLNDGENGLMVACGDSSAAYAKEVVNLFRDRERLDQLRNGALESAARHDIETMVENFSAGIIQALEAPVGHEI
jgi:glycosyltransferase involved in cell wall biosynthesis